MKKETKNTLLYIGVIGAVFTLIIGMFVGLNNYHNRSKFKIGDCVEEVYENEFKRTAYYHDILKVGKKLYLTNQKAGGGKYYINSDLNTELKFSLNEYDTVDKSLCVAKVYKWQ